MQRNDQRQPKELRPVTLTRGYSRHAEGSVLIEFGDTRVICTASVEARVPAFLRGGGRGWITAQYGMLPRSTHTRNNREATQGKQSGRTLEIQRLIGRSLRAVVDLEKLGEKTITLDCDVLQADGGTRTASITGGCVAVAIALNRLMGKGLLKDFPLRKLVAAVSAGIYQHEAILDLNYPEDRDASVDFNVVMTESGEFVELQGSGEEDVFTSEQMTAMLDLSRDGITKLVELQKEAILAADKPSSGDLDGLAASFQH